MRLLPHWQIEQALRLPGQKRQRTAGSDVIDGYLAALAAYTAELYVDKRTAEDFRQAMVKVPATAALIGRICKAGHYTELL